MSINKLTQILIATLLLSSVVFAAPSQKKADSDSGLYQVELIVFERPLGEQLQREAWPVLPPLDTASAISIAPLPAEQQPTSLPLDAESQVLAQFDTMPHAFSELPIEYQKMQYIEAMLHKKAGFKILLHESWLQPLLSKHFSRPIKISGGEVLAKVTQSFNSMDEAAMLAQDTEQHELEGMLSISKARYINVQANLMLTVNDVPAAFREELIKQSGDDAAVPRFHLLQSRRMQENELHYFDHPLFGMLVRISPFDPNASDETDASA